MMIVPFASGSEHDALTKARHFRLWRPGVRKAIKRLHNRKVRQHLKLEMAAEGRAAERPGVGEATKPE